MFRHHSNKTILSKSYSAAMCWLWKPCYTAKQYQDLKRHSESDRCFYPQSVPLMTFYKGKGYMISTGKMIMDVRDTVSCWVMHLFCVKLCAASILSQSLQVSCCTITRLRGYCMGPKEEEQQQVKEAWGCKPREWPSAEQRKAQQWRYCPNSNWQAVTELSYRFEMDSAMLYWTREENN